MEKKLWDELGEKFEAAMTKGASKIELAGILKHQLAVSTTTDEALISWGNYNSLIKKGVLDDIYITLQEFFSVAFRLIADRSDAWNLFTDCDNDCAEAELAFDKVMSMCSFQEDVLWYLDCYGGVRIETRAREVVSQGFCSRPGIAASTS